MKNIRILSLPIIALMLASCASDDTRRDSVDSEGNCTHSFVNDYNSIIHEVETSKLSLKSKYSTESEISAQITTLNNACEKFYSKHSDVTCTAEVNYKKTEISSDDLKKPCDAASKFTEKKDAETDNKSQE